ncbi:carbohydrate porin [uncultured Salinisphaera sp.]|uniref:carbohydrate porin n=1 Tax=uncultured Salinisphaera sp. TaxID=359372 RepID=UPI0032B130DC
MRRWSGRALAPTLLLGAGIAAAGPSQAESTYDADVSGAPDIATRDTLLGDMGGLRPAAQARGLSFDAVAIGDYSIVLDGGAEPRATAARYLIEAGIELDTEAAFGWPGGTLRASYLGFHGDNGNLDSGDIQVYSNIDETPLDAFYSLWYRQDLFDERLAIKIGKMDANEDFAYVDNGDQFLNSSPGFSPTILAFPSYPDPATGIALFAELPAGVYARAGVYDGSSLNGRRTGTRGPDNFLGDDSDRFSVGEVGLEYRLAELDGRLGFGYWRHDGDFPRFDGGVDDSSDGVYLVWDQSLYDDPASPLAVDGFAQYGRADEQVSELASHIGAGVQVTGLIADRPDDLTGLMVSRVDFSDAPGAGFTQDHETALEVFHAVQVTPWMALKPDFQYIVNPGGMGLDDARVATLRGEIAF